MSFALRKWWALFSIYFQDGIAYRASGVIWIVTDLVVAVTMPLVWASASRSGLIQGFGASDFVLYYLAMLLLNSFITSHIAWELAMEIKEGQFSTVLVRPVPIYQWMFLRSLAWRVIRPMLFFPFLIALLFLYRGYLGDVHLFWSWPFWLSLFLGHLLSFMLSMMIASFALLLEDTMALFELYYMPMMFLSGNLFPVAVLPAWARDLAHLMPFYYTVGAPTEMLIGRIDPARMLPLLGMQLVWIVGVFLVGQALWRWGLRYYTAVGM